MAHRTTSPDWVILDEFVAAYEAARRGSRAADHADFLHRAGDNTIARQFRCGAPSHTGNPERVANILPSEGRARGAG